MRPGAGVMDDHGHTSLVGCDDSPPPSQGVEGCAMPRSHSLGLLWPGSGVLAPEAAWWVSV